MKPPFGGALRAISRLAALAARVEYSRTLPSLLACKTRPCLTLHPPVILQKISLRRRIAGSTPKNLPAAAGEPPRRSCFALAGCSRFSGDLALRHSAHLPPCSCLECGSIFVLLTSTLPHTASADCSRAFFCRIDKTPCLYYGNKSCHKSGYRSFTKFGTLPAIMNRGRGKSFFFHCFPPGPGNRSYSARRMILKQLKQQPIRSGSWNAM